MGSATISVELDEKLQIVRQRVEGFVDDEDSVRLYELTALAVARLADPHTIKILTESNEIGKTSSKARKALLDNLQDPDLYKIAVIGKNPYMRVLFEFIMKVKGTKKARMFSNERDAIRWLNE